MIGVSQVSSPSVPMRQCSFLLVAMCLVVPENSNAFRLGDIVSATAVKPASSTTDIHQTRVKYSLDLVDSGSGSGSGIDEISSAPTSPPTTTNTTSTQPPTSATNASGAPTLAPSATPSASPTISANFTSTSTPTASPVTSQNGSGTASPNSASPTSIPTVASASPSSTPTRSPSVIPTATPTRPMSLSPSKAPTTVPTSQPTPFPTAQRNYLVFAPTSSPGGTSAPTVPPQQRIQLVAVTVVDQPISSMDTVTKNNVKFSLGSAMVAELIVAGARSTLKYSDIERDELIDTSGRARSNAVQYSAQFASAEVSDNQAQSAAVGLENVGVSYLDSSGNPKVASITAMAVTPITPISKSSTNSGISAGAIVGIVMTCVLLIILAVGFKVRQNKRPRRTKPIMGESGLHSGDRLVPRVEK